MELEWRTSDKNTVLGECDVCHYERPVKRMLIPEVKYFVVDEDDEDEYFYEDEDFQFYCLSCYKQAETENGF